MCGSANNAAGGAGRRIERPGAFTMIELLVVMFILAVLVALVASVGGYVMRSANEKETATIQAVLMDAIQAWHDKDTSTPKQYPPDRTGPTYVPDASAGILMDYLEGRSPPSSTNTPQVRAATEILLKLPKEAWGGPASGPVRDSWGVPMRYHATGGLGGRPVIISAGPDGKFDPSPYDEDNIRSDEAQ